MMSLLITTSICFSIAAGLILPLEKIWQLKRRQVLNLLGGVFIISWLLVSLVQRQFHIDNFVIIGCITFPVVCLVTIGLIYFWFSRDPERVPPEQENAILSPADGQIVYVKKIEQGEIPISVKHNRTMKLNEFSRSDLLNTGMYLVGIGMNVFNVHVNRMPIAGTIRQIKSAPGKFLSLRKTAALQQNERITTIVENAKLRIGIIQIASRLIRRIVAYQNVGDTVSIGQRFGMIKFGSQVDIVIPIKPAIRLCVKPGDEVIAGQSIIGFIE